MWYVMQVKTGREEIIRKALKSAMPEDCIKESRVIRYEVKRKYHGAWHTQEKLLLPGYLFIRTEDVKGLQQELKRIPELTRLLGYDGEIIPLTKEDEAFLHKVSDGSEHVGMSYGIQTGDTIRVQEGPLKGYEASIRKVDRHKRKAYIEIELLGDTRELELGLEIVEKQA